MTREQFDELMPALPAFGKQAMDRLADFTAAHAPNRNDWIEQEVTKWREGKERRKERYTAGEVNEIRDQAAQQVRTERHDAELGLRIAVEVAEEKAAAVEAYSEELRPLWQDVALLQGDYSRAMLRMGEETSARDIRDQLTGVSTTVVRRAYAEAREIGDRVAQRVIENGIAVNGHRLELARAASLEEINDLYLLSREKRAQRRERHPEAVRKLRETIAAVKADPGWTRHNSVKLVLGNTARAVA